MAKIKINDLTTGMHLAADVCDLNGRFLIGTGCEITDKHIKALNAWGVISVEIIGSDIEEETTENVLSNESLNEHKKILEAELTHNDLNHPFIAELLIEATKYRAGKDAGS